MRGVLYLIKLVMGILYYIVLRQSNDERKCSVFNLHDMTVYMKNAQFNFKDILYLGLRAYCINFKGKYCKIL